jgi:hypothetical protein
MVPNASGADCCNVVSWPRLVLAYYELKYEKKNEELFDIEGLTSNPKQK